MKKLITVAILVLVIAAAAAFIVYEGRPYWEEWTKPAPVDMTTQIEFKGRLLHDWVDDLESPDVEVRRKAADALNEIPPKDGYYAMGKLLHAMSDKDNKIRCRAGSALAHVLTEVNTPAPLGMSVTPALIEVLLDKDPKVRREGAEVLARFGPMVGGAVPSLKYLAKNDKDEEVRQACARAVEKIQPEHPDANAKRRRGSPEAKRPAPSAHP